MKTLFISILALFSFTSFSQELAQSKNSPSIVLGATFNNVLSFSDNPDRYTLYPNSSMGYYVNETYNGSSNFFQVESEFRWNKVYASVGVGIGLEKIDLTATSISEWGNAGAGGSSSSHSRYDITARENHAYLIASLETGYLFLKPSSRFQLGLGLGADFKTDLSSTIQENKIIWNNKSVTNISGGPNAGTTTTYSSAEYDNNDDVWSNMVRDSEIFWLMPKVGISGRCNITEKLGLSIKANTRFLLYRKYNSLQLKTRFPIGIGVYYTL